MLVGLFDFLSFCIQYLSFFSLYLEVYGCSHVFKTNSSCNNCVKHVSSLLSQELENIFYRYMHLHNLNCYNTVGTCNSQICNKTCNFYSLPPLLPFSFTPDNFISARFPDKEIVFSGKHSLSGKSRFFQNQLTSKFVLCPISSIPNVKIIDTMKGGVHYLNKKLAFILVP